MWEGKWEKEKQWSAGNVSPPVVLPNIESFLFLQGCITAAARRINNLCFDECSLSVESRSDGTLTTLRVNFSREVRRPCSVSGWRVTGRIKGVQHFSHQSSDIFAYNFQFENGCKKSSKRLNARMVKVAQHSALAFPHCCFTARSVRKLIFFSKFWLNSTTVKSDNPFKTLKGHQTWPDITNMPSQTVVISLALPWQSWC